MSIILQKYLGNPIIFVQFKIIVDGRGFLWYDEPVNNDRYEIGGKMAVTKQDIADQLGISRTAVSLALNRSPKCTLSKATQEKIFEAARAMGYPLQKPGTITKKICFALFNMDDKVARTTNSQEINLIDDYLSVRGYHIVYLNVSRGERSIKRFYEYLGSGEAAGLVVFGLTDSTVLQEIESRNIPYMIFSEMEGEPKNGCCPDTYYLAKEMVRKLIRCGHRQIAFFMAPMEFPQQRNLLKGYREALAEAELPFQPELVQVSSMQDGAELAARMEYLGIPYTAAMCANSYIQFGALNWLQQHGISVPGQKSLIGYGLNELSHLASPQLSLYYIDTNELIEAGMSRLMESIENGKKDFPCKWVRSMHHIEGGTVGPAPEVSNS